MSPRSSWFLLLLAGLFEIAWAVGLKYTQGFTRLWPIVGTGAALIISICLLAAALRSLPVGTAYAIWVGIGAIGTAIIGMIAFGESANPARLLSLLLIVLGVAGLKFATSTA